MLYRTMIIFISSKIVSSSMLIAEIGTSVGLHWLPFRMIDTGLASIREGWLLFHFEDLIHRLN